jgi:uncharacterized membrane protein YdjX (TVP38/TMEM64 family)
LTGVWKKILWIAGLGLLLGLAIWYRAPLWSKISQFYDLVSDREKIRTFVSSFGEAAPLVFVVIQILQVLFAPVPGEATGFIGGYLFGTIPGFFYSSIGLTIGSLVNFGIGRFLGSGFARKLIPAAKFEKLDNLVTHRGLLVLFLLFVFPGFPKDYLCLFLGLSTLSWKAFGVLAAVGRMPGTFVLSLQGAVLYERNYAVLAVVAGVFGVIVFLVYRYRETVYGWFEKLNRK